MNFGLCWCPVSLSSWREVGAIWKINIGQGRGARSRWPWLLLLGFIWGSDHLNLLWCSRAHSPLHSTRWKPDSSTHFTLPSNSSVLQSLPFSSVISLIDSKQNFNRSAVIPQLELKLNKNIFLLSHYKAKKTQPTLALNYFSVITNKH